MGLGSKLLAGAGIAGATIAGFRGVSLYRMSHKLEISHRIRAHGISFSGLTAVIDVVIKNPTGNAMNIKYPFVKVKIGDKILAVSEVIDKTIAIKPYSTTEVNNISLPLTAANELKIGASILLPLLAGQTVKIKAITETSVKFFLIPIPYSMEEEVDLNGNTQ